VKLNLKIGRKSSFFITNAFPRERIIEWKGKRAQIRSVVKGLFSFLCLYGWLRPGWRINTFFSLHSFKWLNIISQVNNKR
jgi:hypothetical protein